MISINFWKWANSLRNPYKLKASSIDIFYIIKIKETKKIDTKSRINISFINLSYSFPYFLDNIAGYN